MHTQLYMLHVCGFVLLLTVHAVTNRKLSPPVSRHLQLYRFHFQTAMGAGEYDVPKCAPGTPPVQCIHTISAKIRVSHFASGPCDYRSGLNQLTPACKAGSVGFKPIFLGGHCHVRCLVWTGFGTRGCIWFARVLGLTPTYVRSNRKPIGRPLFLRCCRKLCRNTEGTNLFVNGDHEHGHWKITLQERPNVRCRFACLLEVGMARGSRGGVERKHLHHTSPGRGGWGGYRL
jgi:hypothetical protein